MKARLRRFLVLILSLGLLVCCPISANAMPDFDSLFGNIFGSGSPFGDFGGMGMMPDFGGMGMPDFGGFGGPGGNSFSDIQARYDFAYSSPYGSDSFSMSFPGDGFSSFDDFKNAVSNRLNEFMGNMGGMGMPSFADFGGMGMPDFGGMGGFDPFSDFGGMGGSPFGGMGGFDPFSDFGGMGMPDFGGMGMPDFGGMGIPSFEEFVDMMMSKFGDVPDFPGFGGMGMPDFGGMGMPDFGGFGGDFGDYGSGGRSGRGGRGGDYGGGYGDYGDYGGSGKRGGRSGKSGRGGKGGYGGDYGDYGGGFGDYGGGDRSGRGGRSGNSGRSGRGGYGGGYGDTSGLTSEEQAVFEWVNEERTKRGLHPYQLDMDLVKSARAKSEDMARNYYFDHYSPTYGWPDKLINQYTGGKYWYLGENIAVNNDLRDAFVSFMTSTDGHREAILDPEYTHIGIGVVRDAGSYLVTQHFGAR